MGREINWLFLAVSVSAYLIVLFGAIGEIVGDNWISDNVFFYSLPVMMIGSLFVWPRHGWSVVIKLMLMVAIFLLILVPVYGEKWVNPTTEVWASVVYAVTGGLAILYAVLVLVVYAIGKWRDRARKV